MSAQRRRGTRLYRDAEVGVLWLSRGRHELALSTDGVWVHAGRRRSDLTWDEVEQVQLGDVQGTRARVELFRVGGGAFTLGPFEAPQAERWVRACGDVAAQAGLFVAPLSGGPGFALRPRM